MDPAAPDTDAPVDEPETRQQRRDRRELERLLDVAHRNLDERGVPR